MAEAVPVNPGSLRVAVPDRVSGRTFYPKAPINCSSLTQARRVLTTSVTVASVFRFYALWLLKSSIFSILFKVIF